MIETTTTNRSVGDDPWITDALASLVKVPSVSGSEVPAQALVQRLMESAGADVRRLPVRAARLKDRYGFRTPTDLDDAHSVIALWRSAGAAGPHITINGHVDTVPPGPGWSTDPWEPTVRDGEMFGLGVADMKAGLIGAIAGVARARQRGLRRVTVEIQSVVDEEAGGGTGSLACIDEAIATGTPRPDLVIVAEPTNLRVCTAQVGSRAMRFTVHGVSAHANSKHLGTSATELAIDLAQRLQAATFSGHRVDHPLLPPASVNIGSVVGGTTATAVADKCVLEVCTTYHPADANALDSAIRRIVHGWAEDHRDKQCSLEVEVLHDVHPYETSPRDRFVMQLGSAVSQSDGTAPALNGFPAGSDGRLFHEHLGSPTVIFGPGDIRHIHRPDERVGLADVSRYAETIATFLLTLQIDSEILT